MNLKENTIKKILDYKLGEITKSEIIAYCKELLEKTIKNNEWQTESFHFPNKEVKRITKEFEVSIEVEVNQESTLTYYTISIVTYKDDEIFLLGVSEKNK